MLGGMFLHDVIIKLFCFDLHMHKLAGQQRVMRQEGATMLGLSAYELAWEAGSRDILGSSPERNTSVNTPQVLSML